MRSLPGILGVFLSLACAPAPRGAAPVRATPSEHRGKVVVTGTETSSSVKLVGTNTNVELVGDLEPELRRLAGASLLVRGSLQGPGPAQTLEVSDYEIVDIDGEVPSTGILRNRNGQLWLIRKDTLELVGAPEALRGKDGVKAWVIGKKSGRSLRVQSYGIIKEN